MTECQIPEKVIKDLAFWHGRRYFRSAFPTEFDRRIPRRNRAKLLDLLKDSHELITGIYFDLNTSKELAEEQAYRVKIYMTVDPDDWERPELRTTAMELAGEFQATVDCAGIEVDECEPVSEDDLDLYTVSRSIRFDQFDFLSAEMEGDEEQQQEREAQ